MIGLVAMETRPWGIPLKRLVARILFQAQKRVCNVWMCEKGRSVSREESPLPGGIGAFPDKTFREAVVFFREAGTASGTSLALPLV